MVFNFFHLYCKNTVFSGHWTLIGSCYTNSLNVSIHWDIKVVKSKSPGLNGLVLLLLFQKRHQSQREGRRRRSLGQLVKALICRKTWLLHHPTLTLEGRWADHPGPEDLEPCRVRVPDRAEAVGEGPLRDNSVKRSPLLQAVFIPQSVHFKQGVEIMAFQ